MQFIDTHTHLSDQAYGDIEGQDAAVKRALEQNVNMMVIPDVNSRERKGVLELCKRWPDNTRACLGLHPTDVAQDWKEELDLLYKAAKENPGIVAIGETGMDFHYGREMAAEQEEVFRAQLDLALSLDLPLIIHAREATDTIFKVLDDYRGRGLRGVFHAYSGSLETFRQLDRYGNWSVGIGGVLTFKKASIADIVVDIPMERILLETDSPYLTPVPYRGQRNESSYIPLIAAFLAGRKGIDVEEVASTTSENANRLFSL